MSSTLRLMRFLVVDSNGSWKEMLEHKSMRSIKQGMHQKQTTSCVRAHHPRMRHNGPPPTTVLLPLNSLFTSVIACNYKS